MDRCWYVSAIGMTFEIARTMSDGTAHVIAETDLPRELYKKRHGLLLGEEAEYYVLAKDCIPFNDVDVFLPNDLFAECVNCEKEVLALTDAFIKGCKSNDHVGVMCYYCEKTMAQKIAALSKNRVDTLQWAV